MTSERDLAADLFGQDHTCVLEHTIPLYGDGEVDFTVVRDINISLQENNLLVRSATQNAESVSFPLAVVQL